MRRASVFLAAATGVAAFLLVAVGHSILLAVAFLYLLEGAIALGGAGPGPAWGWVILAAIISVSTLGGVLPLLALGIDQLHALLFSLVAQLVAVYIDFGADKRLLDLFDTRQTLALVVGAALTVLLGIADSGKADLKVLIAPALVSAVFVVLSLLVPNDSSATGAVISLLAWISIPMTAAWLTTVHRR